MRRREFITLLGGAAAAWPIAARAQPAVPVVGYLASSSADAPSGPVAAIHLGLTQAGYELGRTVRMEYRYANNQLDRLPTLAAELVGIPAAVIVTSGGPRPTLVAKAATTTIPIVFAPIPDPVRSGLVASFNRPGGNITGIAALTIELDPKRLELLHELTPSGGPLGVLLNPSRPDLQIQAEGIEAAARSVGRQLVPAYASTGPQIDAAFATLAQQSVAGLLVAADAFFSSQRIRSSCWQPATAGRRSINGANSLMPEVWQATERACSIPTDKWACSSRASSRAKSPPNCRCSNRRSSSSSSISGPHGRSA